MSKNTIKILACFVLSSIPVNGNSSATAPYELYLPDGTVQVACGVLYDLDTKFFVFESCPNIFYNGFE